MALLLHAPPCELGVELDAALCSAEEARVGEAEGEGVVGEAAVSVERSWDPSAKKRSANEPVDAPCERPPCIVAPPPTPSLMVPCLVSRSARCAAPL